MEKYEELGEKLDYYLNICKPLSILICHVRAEGLVLPVDQNIVYTVTISYEEFEDDENRNLHSWIKKKCETEGILDLTLHAADEEYEIIECNLVSIWRRDN